MTTAFIGQFGQRDLVAELCLAEALRAFPDDNSVAVSADPAWTMRNAPVGRAVLATEFDSINFERIVVAGPLSDDRALTEVAALFSAGVARGAEGHVHNLSFETSGGPSPRAVVARRQFAGAITWSVRDFMTLEVLTNTANRGPPRMAAYAERFVEPEFGEGAAVWPRPIGVALSAAAGTAAGLEADAAAVGKWLDSFGGARLRPLIWFGGPGVRDHAAGFRLFQERFAVSRALVADEVLDAETWYGSVTARTAKAALAECRAIVTDDDGVLAMCAAHSVPALGIASSSRAPVLRAAATLANAWSAPLLIHGRYGETMREAAA
jgi:hypothetical protein